MEGFNRKIDIEKCMKIHGNYNADSDSEKSDDMCDLPPLIPYGKVKNIVFPSDTDVRPLVEIHLQSELNENEKLERSPEMNSWLPKNEENSFKSVNNIQTYASVTANGKKNQSTSESSVSRTDEMIYNSQINTELLRQDFEKLIITVPDASSSANSNFHRMYPEDFTLKHSEMRYVQKSKLRSRTLVEPIVRKYYEELYRFRTYIPAHEGDNLPWCVIL